MKTIVKALKKGEFFTKKDIEFPGEMQVWIRGDYIREDKKYECICWGGVNKFCYMKGTKEVFTGFTF